MQTPVAATGAAGSVELPDLERATIARVTRRLIPFLFICYFVAFLDRVNVGFAALTMSKALGFSAQVFGFGGGIFFFGYFLFEVPSNIILDRVGARMWIARIMITWGIISGLTAVVSGPISFYVIRFLLGLAEAGFFPGVIFFLTLWFPSQYRSRIVGMFMMAIPFSIVLGSLISSPIFLLDGFLGVAGWQWIFVAEAVPALVLGVIVMFYLTDRPAEASWLEPAQRQWLVERLAVERAQRERIRRFDILDALRCGRVWGLTAVYFGMNVAGYGLVLFLPQIIHKLGVSIYLTGLVTAIPYACAAACMVLWGRHSDHSGERSLHAAGGAFLLAFGLAACTFISNPVVMLAAITLAAIGGNSFNPVFWALPTAMLSGTAAAAGIALINAVGNLGGFLGPYLVGLIKDSTGSFTLGLLAIALGPIAAGIIVLALGHDRRLEYIPDRPG